MCLRSESGRTRLVCPSSCRSRGRPALAHLDLHSRLALRWELCPLCHALGQGTRVAENDMSNDFMKDSIDSHVFAERNDVNRFLTGPVRFSLRSAISAV